MNSAAEQCPRRNADAEMDCWISTPKLELHAHLNGSIRGSTLLELARVLGEKGVIVFSDVERVILKDDRSLHEVFKFFDLIHILTTDHNAVTRITKEVVIEDFASESIVYLELRTTPKKNGSKGMSELSYSEAVIEGLRAGTEVEDDSGVFSTSLWKECSIASSAFALGRRELFQLARNGIEYIFAGAEVKQDLAEIFNSAAEEFDL